MVGIEIDLPTTETEEAILTQEAGITPSTTVVSAARERVGHDARTLIYLSVPPTAVQSCVPPHRPPSRWDVVRVATFR